MRKDIDLSFADDGGGWRALIGNPEAVVVNSTLPAEAYAVVVGAGFTGLAAARELAVLHPKKQIVVLEARTIGAAASGRNAGFAVSVSRTKFSGFSDADHMAENQRINRINDFGIEYMRPIVSAKAGNACWQNGGYYHLAASAAGLANLAGFQQSLDALGKSYRRLDTLAISSELGTDYYKAGLFVAHGVLINPYTVLRSLAENLPANVTVMQHTALVSYRAGNSIYLQTTQGALRCEKLILATNFESSNLSETGYRLSATTLCGSFTECLNDSQYASMGSVEMYGILSLHDGGATVRLTADRRIMLRNTVDFLDGRLHSKPQREALANQHLNAILNRYPQLEGISIAHTWSGCEGVTRNATSIVKQLADNIYCGCGYNGSGVSRGTSVGVGLARLASARHDQLTEDILGFSKPKFIPPWPLRDYAAKWVLRQRFRNVAEDL